MVLSDTDILKWLREGGLGIDPIEDLDKQIQPASVDLRLADEIVIYKKPPMHPETGACVLDPKNQSTINAKKGTTISLLPITETVERVKREVPIWKKEFTAKNSHWVSTESSHE